MNRVLLYVERRSVFYPGARTPQAIFVVTHSAFVPMSLLEYLGCHIFGPQHTSQHDKLVPDTEGCGGSRVIAEST